MYKVYYTNFGYSTDIDFDTIESAKKYGISKGFQFTVFNMNTYEVVYTSSIIV